MADTLPNLPPTGPAEPKLKIYFLPNLLTAANLFCGFIALTKIVEADISTGNFSQIKLATCLMAGWRGWAAWRARLGASSTPWQT